MKLKITAEKKQKIHIKSYLEGWQLAQKNLSLIERETTIQAFRDKKF